VNRGKLDKDTCTHFKATKQTCMILLFILPVHLPDQISQERLTSWLI